MKKLAVRKKKNVNTFNSIWQLNNSFDTQINCFFIEKQPNLTTEAVYTQNKPELNKIAITGYVTLAFKA